mmetsp:Transcript_31572/g.100981  ORF Transcript_31572/g.100981 Transcript_31572/m.100981 type:complete len:840 (-) Transcript_31572:42-2561(-)
MPKRRPLNDGAPPPDRPASRRKTRRGEQEGDAGAKVEPRSLSEIDPANEGGRAKALPPSVEQDVKESSSGWRKLKDKVSSSAFSSGDALIARAGISLPGLQGSKTHFSSSSAAGGISPRRGFVSRKWLSLLKKMPGSQQPVRMLEAEANKDNAHQALLSTIPGTIWNAVTYAHTEQGQKSWRMATSKNSKTVDWMTGERRGIMGETPLHLAVLFNSSKEHNRLMHQLWDNYPELRTAVYEGNLYKGENVLHIAIVRKLDMSIIRKFVESDEGKVLLNQQAVGSFFKDPKLSDGCCNYGEFPLAFAACTNQRGVFDYLVSQGASLEMKTSEGYNLLHLMVLHSSRRTEGTGESQQEWGGEFEAGGQQEEESSSWCCDMYDHIEELMRREGIYETLSNQRCYREHHTPLSLSAARGSLKIFNHLLDKLMTTEWVYGPVTCRRLYLKGVDVPLEGLEEKEHQEELSVLEVVVSCQRLDILESGELKKVLDQKWKRYAKQKFRSKFWLGVGFGLLLMILSTTEPGSSSSWNLWLTFVELLSVMLYMDKFGRELTRLLGQGRTAYFNTNRAHLFDRVYALLTTPIAMVIVFLRWRKCFSREPGHVPLFVLGLHMRANCRQFSWELSSQLEKFLLILQSILSSLNLFRGMMGFPEYGHFVLIIIQMLKHDTRKFLIIYSIFLIGFSQLLYVMLDLQNSGLTNFFSSMMIGFNAALEQVDLDIEGLELVRDKTKRMHLSYGNRILILFIVLLNFFLVSIVLINLLIAMMSSTYEGINQGAKTQWSLVRARIITNLDKEMSEADRRNASNIYWIEEADASSSHRRVRRFMTFITSEKREAFLQGISN